MIDVDNISTHDIARQKLELKFELQSSLLLFTRFMYKQRTGRPFCLSHPIGRESHYITFARALTQVFWGETQNLLINVQPGTGKSEMFIGFVAFSLSFFPDCQFIYQSVSHGLAAEHVRTIRDTINLPAYRQIFDIRLSQDVNAKDHFKTEAGGCVKAFGSEQNIVGYNAGLPYVKRFSGAVIMDDPHNPNDVFSDTLREKVVTNYMESVKVRRRSPTVPMLLAAQRTHPMDLSGFILEGLDGEKWLSIILAAIDEAGNVLFPEKNTYESLMSEKEHNEYVFWSQLMQQPKLRDGGIFKREFFAVLDKLPNIITTFITADTAEGTKTYNDHTVFSFWGVFKLGFNGVETDEYGLVWLDCRQMKVEPRLLEDEFIAFWTQCMRFHVQPEFAAIEKKSTGSTLISVLTQVPGIRTLDIERTAASGNKASRYLEMQPYLSRRKVVFINKAAHKDMCIDHMTEITLNDTHKHDDICDTAYDAIKIALINKSIQALKARMAVKKAPVRIGNLTQEARARTNGYRKQF